MWGREDVCVRRVCERCICGGGKMCVRRVCGGRGDDIHVRVE